MRPHPGNSKLSTGSGLAAILLWSATFALARSLSEQVGALTAGASVYLLGGLCCLLALWWRKSSPGRFRKMPRRYLFGCGFLFILYTALIYSAVGLAYCKLTCCPERYDTRRAVTIQIGGYG